MTAIPEENGVGLTWQAPTESLRGGLTRVYAYEIYFEKGYSAPKEATMSGILGAGAFTTTSATDYRHDTPSNTELYCYVVSAKFGGTEAYRSNIACAKPRVAPPRIPGTALPNAKGGMGTAVAYDKDGKAHIVFVDATSLGVISQQRLLYVTNATSDGSWSTPEAIVGSLPTPPGNYGGPYVSVAVFWNPVFGVNEIVATYYEKNNKDLVSAGKSTGGWIFKTIDAQGDVGFYNSVSCDVSACHAVYYDTTNSALKYSGLKLNLGFAGSTWSAPEVIDAAGETGFYPDIAVGSDFKGHVCFYDRTNGNLKYASAANLGGPSGDIGNTDWSVTTIDASPKDVGRYCSIDVDPSGNFHVSYFDATTGSLKYYNSTPSPSAAARASGNLPMGSMVVDQGPGVGRYSSLVVDGGGRPHIVYYNEVSKDLLYRTASPVTIRGSADTMLWAAPLSIDTAGKVGGFASLGISKGALNVLFTSYYNATLDNLMGSEGPKAVPSRTRTAPKGVVESIRDFFRF